MLELLDWLAELLDWLAGLLDDETELLETELLEAELLEAELLETEDKMFDLATLTAEMTLLLEAG